MPNVEWANVTGLAERTPWSSIRCANPTFFCKVRLKKNQSRKNKDSVETARSNSTTERDLFDKT